MSAEANVDSAGNHTTKRKNDAEVHEIEYISLFIPLRRSASDGLTA